MINALGGGGRSLIDLRREAGSPPQTTMRVHLRRLREVGVVEAHRREEFPGTAHYELTDSGRFLLEVSRQLSLWLGRGPRGPIELGTAEAKSVIKALVGGWSAGIVRALAVRPLALTELDRVISSLSYPSLERRLAAMRLHDLVESAREGRRGNPYVVTDWLRLAVIPIAAAACWERRYWSQAPPITNRDIEAAFLLALPLTHPPADTTGFCRLAVQMANGSIGRLAGATVEARGGEIISCTTRIEGSPDASALGTPSTWLSALLSPHVHQLEMQGDSRLATALITAMHQALFDKESLHSANGG